VPPTLNPPVRVEESVTEPPAAIAVAERVVAMLGLALVTVRGSQALVAGALLASPL